jgi:hypothetical protein
MPFSKHVSFRLLAGLYLSFVFVDDSQASGLFLSPTSDSELRDIQQSDESSLYIECDLRNVGLDCENDVRNVFFTEFPNIKRANSAEAALISVKITDERNTVGTVVRFNWSSDPKLGVEEFKLSIRFNLEDASVKRESIKKALIKGVVAHLEVLSGTAAENTISTSYQTGNTIPKSTSSYSGPFYLNAAINGFIARSGIGALDSQGAPQGINSTQVFNSSFVANYSTVPYRFKVNVSDSRTLISVPNGSGGNISSRSSNFYVSTLAIHSLGKAGSTAPRKWNVLLLAEYNRSPNANIQNSLEVRAGMEYTIVPFRIEQTKEFRFQLSATNQRLSLLSENSRGNLEENTVLALARLYLYWLMNDSKVSVSLGISGSQNLNLSQYRSYGFSTSFSYQITKSVRFDTSGAYSYQTKSLTFPGTPDYSNPTQTQFLSGSAGGNIFFNAGVTLTILNGLLFSRDTRGN